MAEVTRIGGFTRQQRNARILRREPLCRPCSNAIPQRITAAVEVDHIIPLDRGGTEAEDNLQPICSRCHKAKTKLEFAGDSVWPYIGEDGWPSERLHPSLAKGSK